MFRTLGLVAALATGSLLLAACDDDPAPADTTSVAIDAAAVTSIQGMIPHHAQAIEMAALAADRSQNPAVLAIADRIQGAQDPRDRADAWLARRVGARRDAGARPGRVTHALAPAGGSLRPRPVMDGSWISSDDNSAEHGRRGRG